MWFVDFLKYGILGFIALLCLYPVWLLRAEMNRQPVRKDVLREIRWFMALSLVFGLATLLFSYFDKPRPIELPIGASSAECVSYVSDAKGSYCGRCVIQISFRTVGLNSPVPFTCAGMKRNAPVRVHLLATSSQLESDTHVNVGMRHLRQIQASFAFAAAGAPVVSEPIHIDPRSPVPLDLTLNGRVPDDGTVTANLTFTNCLWNTGSGNSQGNCTFGGSADISTF